MENSTDRKYRIMDVRVAVDVSDPDETKILSRMRRRAALFDQAEAELERESASDNTTPNADTPTTPEAKSRRQKKGASLPTGDNLLALQVIEAHGEIDYDYLCRLMFGDSQGDTEDEQKKDKKRQRNNTYSRINQYKKKGWLVQTPEGDWKVAEEIVNLPKSKEENEIDIPSWLEGALTDT